MLTNKDKSIAVIDSGVGGISVLRELVEIMPNENYIYFGDSANAPYGTKDKNLVLEITRRNLELLKTMQIKALVIACNTATSVAIKALRKENPEIPIIGIEPAIKPPAMELEHPRVLVMATPLTLREEKFLTLVDQFSHMEEIIPLPCPGLAELIETGKLDSPEIDNYIKNLFLPYANQKIDALVLGCTHYPHIKNVILKHISPKIKIYDGGHGTAIQTKRKLEELELTRESTGGSQVVFLNSLDNPELIELSKKLLYRE